MKAAFALIGVVLLLAACGGTQVAQQPAPEPPAIVAEPEPAPAPPAPAPPAAQPPAGKEPIAAGASDAKNIEYDQNDFVTNVACDYEKGTVSFTLKNTAGKDFTLYHGEVPQSPNSLKISVNGMQFNSPKLELKLDCGDVALKSGDTRSCVGDNIQYRKPEGTASDVTYNQKGKNRLLAQYIGFSDVTFFECYR